MRTHSLAIVANLTFAGLALLLTQASGPSQGAGLVGSLPSGPTRIVEPGRPLGAVRLFAFDRVADRRARDAAASAMQAVTARAHQQPQALSKAVVTPVIRVQGPSLSQPISSHTLSIKRTTATSCPSVYTGNSVKVANLAGTGMNHWWAYKGDRLSGIGSYLVNVASGNMLVAVSDMSVAHKGIPLSLERAYNSQSSHVANGKDGSPNLYGDGWTNNFDVHIAYNDSAQSNCQLGVTIFDAGGAHYDYAPSGDGHTFIAPAGQFAKLYYDGTNYYWTKKSGMQDVFWDVNQPASSVGYSGQIRYIFGRNVNTSLTFQRSWTTDASSLDHLQTMTVSSETTNGMTLVATLNFGDVSQLGATFRLLQSLVWPDQSTTVTYKYTVQQCSCPGNSEPLLTEVDEPGNNVASLLAQQYLYHSGSLLLTAAYSPRWVLKPNQVGDGPGYSFGYDSSNALDQVQYFGDVNPEITGSAGTSYLQPSATHDLGYSVTGYRTANLSYSSGSTSWSDSDGHQTVLTFDAVGRLTQASETTGDPSGGVAAFTTYQTWDAQNDLITSRGPRSAGSSDTTYETDYAYDDDGNVIAAAQPAVGNFRPTSLFSYDANANLTNVCDPIWSHANGKDWSARPGASDALCPSQAGTTRFTWTSQAYEPYGELTEMIQPATSTAPNGYAVAVAYAPASQGGTDFGLPTSITGAAFQNADSTQVVPQTSLAYDRAGNVVCLSKASGEWSVFVYDGLSRLLESGDPDDASLTASGCSKTPGLPGSHIVTTNSYYSDGALASTQTPSEYATGVSTQFTYDADGNETSVMRHYGNTAGTTQEIYDGADRLVEVELPYASQTDSDGFRSDYYPFAWMTRYLYDLTQGGTIVLSGSTPVKAYGNMFKTQLYLSGGWTNNRGNAYDALDRVTLGYNYGMSATKGSSTTYDATATTIGLVSSSCNAVAQCQSQTYDAIGRPTQTSFSGTDAPQTRQYGYDADGRPTSIAQLPFGTQYYSYDGAGELITSTEPTGVITSPAQLTYSYYPNGWRAGISVAPVSGYSGFTQPSIFTFDYRNDGLLTTVAYVYSGAKQPGTYQFNWSYTNGGRTSTRADLYGITHLGPGYQYTYDGYGRVSQYAIPVGTYSSIAYDAEGDVTSYVAYGGSTTHLWYNQRGEIEDVPASPWTYLHGADGFIVASQPLNGTYYEDGSSWNALTGALTGSKLPAASTCWTANNGASACPSTSWTYDAAGRQTSASDVVYLCVRYGCGAHAGSLSRSYDAENHLLGTSFSGWHFLGVKGASSSITGYTLNTAYEWGPNGRPAVMNGESIHWDGAHVLFTTKSSGAVDIINVGPLGTVTPLDSGWAGLTLWDRNLSGIIESQHNNSVSFGHGGWAPYYSNPTGCGPLSVQPSTNYKGPADGATPCNALTSNIYVGNGGWLSWPDANGYSDGFTTFQGVRNSDAQLGTFLTPDPFSGRLNDPMSQQPYVLDRNNGLSFADPSGYDGLDSLCGFGGTPGGKCAAETAGALAGGKIGSEILGPVGAATAGAIGAAGCSESGPGAAVCAAAAASRGRAIGSWGGAFFGGGIGGYLAGRTYDAWQQDLASANAAGIPYPISSKGVYIQTTLTDDLGVTAPGSNADLVELITTYSNGWITYTNTSSDSQQSYPGGELAPGQSVTIVPGQGIYFGTYWDAQQADVLMNGGIDACPDCIGGRMPL